MNVFITGASSGIGHALAGALLNKDSSVYAVSRREPSDLHDPNFRFCSLDLADFDAIPSAVHELLRGIPRIDLAILNAGVLGKIGDLRETPVTEMRRVLDVNLWANKCVIDALLSLKIPTTQIVAISSGAAAHAARGWNAYSISKGALNTLIALYAAEAPQTHFSALAPGIIDTAMQDQISALPDDPRFISFEYLREAKGTPLMPKATETAERLLAGMEKARKERSGSFLDINTLVKRSWA
jgi:NAD(P)-dependent dehydrogenase (short-subunit alcohol dehydrogenase family)